MVNLQNANKMLKYEELQVTMQKKGKKFRKIKKKSQKRFGSRTVLKIVKKSKKKY